MKVLVVIVTYNGEVWIEKCLDSIHNSSIEADIFIVDNGSSDNTINIIERDYKDAILIKSKDNLGFGKANNIGLKYAIENNYDYVYLLNQDAWLFEDTLSTLISVNEKNPDFGILSPMQISKSGNIDSNFLHWVPKQLTNDMYTNQIREVYESKFIMAAHWLISKNCLATVGGFSPTFPHYGEDDNYIDRANYHGFKIGIAPSTKAIHDREYRPTPLSKTFYLYYTRALAQRSNPNIKTNLLKILFDNFIRLGLKHRKMKPIGFMFKFLFSQKTIKKNIGLSKNKMAFI